MSHLRIGALIYGAQKHYLDHLAPLASLLDIPLIVTESEIERLVQAYYPDVTLLFWDPVEVGEKGVSNFDVMISCLPKDLFESIFFISESLHQKKLLSVWCPHGNSDKGHASFFMEGLSKERWVCVYGNQMIDFLKVKGAFNQLEDCFILGNYRYEYFKAHSGFYREVIDKTLSFPKKNPVLLYAPTWNDSEASSSFDLAANHLITQTPDHWNLIVKPHPHLKNTLKSPKENILILDDFPPIYPLLDSVDVYLGDMSSIGYDFLTFQRPMFFFNPQNRDPQKDPGLRLTQCGTIVNPESNLFSIIEETDPSPFIKIQKGMYDTAFGKTPTINKIYDTFTCKV